MRFVFLERGHTEEPFGIRAQWLCAVVDLAAAKTVDNSPIELCCKRCGTLWGFSSTAAAALALARGGLPVVDRNARACRCSLCRHICDGKRIHI